MSEKEKNEILNGHEIQKAMHRENAWLISI